MDQKLVNLTSVRSICLQSRHQSQKAESMMWRISQLVIQKRTPAVHQLLLGKMILKLSPLPKNNRLHHKSTYTSTERLEARCRTHVGCVSLPSPLCSASSYQDVDTFIIHIVLKDWTTKNHSALYVEQESRRNTEASILYHLKPSKDTTLRQWNGSSAADMLQKGCGSHCPVSQPSQGSYQSPPNPPEQSWLSKVSISFLIYLCKQWYCWENVCRG